MNWRWVARNTVASALVGTVLTVALGLLVGHIAWENLAWGAWGYMLAAAAPEAPRTN